MQTRQFIVGTAGHIDHGKTSLVRALTGVDLDSLPEERDRGITIALGFTHLTLPSGRVASFVDVPGHERLVRTMIAGATGLDAALFCVSAVEGVMPQTREHLSILELLGVRHGVVALTMTDLVDEEMLELAEMDVAEAVEGTFLQDAPVIATAAGPQPRGLEALREALDALPEADHDPHGVFRLPIDRAFIRRGFGTVITGTVRAGQVSDGDDVIILPERLRARVRGLQVHGQKVEHSTKGLRTALNLAGIERDDLDRGMVVVHPGVLEPASILDVEYRHIDPAVELPDGGRVRLLVGTAEVMAVVTVLDPSLLQLRTEAPLVAMPSDRFILRRESPVTTLGGGEILDPWARRARRRDRERVVGELRSLRDGDRSVFLLRAAEAGLSPDQARLRRAEGALLGDRVFHPGVITRLEDVLLANLSTWHQDNPLVAGAPRRELHSHRLGHLSDRVFTALVEHLSDQGRLVLDGPRLRLPEFQVRMTPAHQAAAEAIAATLLQAGLQGPKLYEVQGEDPALLRLLIDQGRVVRVADRALHPTPLRALTTKVQAHLQAHGTLSPADFKALTGLTRKHAIPLLEWLDSQRITVRDGDVRRPG